MTLILFLAVWVIGVFMSSLASNIGLMASTGNQNVIWTYQNMLSSLVGLASMGLFCIIVDDGFTMFAAIFNVHFMIPMHSFSGLYSVLLFVGLARFIAGTYEATTTILTSRARDSLRQHVLDIRQGPS